MRRKAKRWKTIRAPEGYRIVQQQYLGEMGGQPIRTIKVFFELEDDA